MRTHRGASLIELLLIMSACTVVLTLTGVLLHRAMLTQIQSRSYVNAEHDALRLSDQFRSDVHRAQAAVARSSDKDERTFLRLELNDGHIVEYLRVQNIVQRTESGRSQPIWHEEFYVPATDMLTIERTVAPERLVLMIVRRPTEQTLADGKTAASANSASVCLCAEAALGQDLRFSAPLVNQEAKK